jgi:DNA-binding HxlR family transcriptional regulator
MPKRRRQDGVHEKHVKLLGRIGRTRHGDGDSRLGTSANPEAGKAGVEGACRALDWRAVLAQLSPVRHRWDLAILCHLDGAAGRRPADLLAAINAEGVDGRRLSPQVLSGRLRELERDEYIRHEDLSVMPLHRLYYLQAPGQALISDLLRITAPHDDLRCG